MFYHNKKNEYGYIYYTNPKIGKRATISKLLKYTYISTTQLYSRLRFGNLQKFIEPIHVKK